jgi:hypothetical protein
MTDNRTYRDFDDRDAFLAWAAQRIRLTRDERRAKLNERGNEIVGTSNRPILGPSPRNVPHCCPTTSCD